MRSPIEIGYDLRVQLEVKIKVVCIHCRGTGLVKNTSGERCPICNATEDLAYTETINGRVVYYYTEHRSNDERWAERIVKWIGTSVKEGKVDMIQQQIYDMLLMNRQLQGIRDNTELKLIELYNELVS